MRRYVFVTGIARSGTTLVANLLNAQHGVTLWSNALSAPLAAASRLGSFERELDARERNIALSWIDHELQALPVRLRLAPKDFRNVRELYRCVLDGISAPNDVVVGHKLNGFGPHTNVFWQLLDETEVLLVCVVRDIRDVLLSQTNHLHASLTPVACWRAVADHAARMRAHCRCVLLRFEDLLRNPLTAVAPLEALLELDIQTNLDSLRHIDQPWLENSAFHDVERLFDSRSLERWRGHLNDPLVREASFHCRRALRLLGYPDFSEPLQFGEQLRFAGHAARARGIELVGGLARRVKQRAMSRTGLVG